MRRAETVTPPTEPHTDHAQPVIRLTARVTVCMLATLVQELDS